MRTLKAVLIPQLLFGVMCFVGVGCSSESPNPPSSPSQADTKSATQMTKAEFQQRLEQVLREGGAPTEVAGVILGGVCDAAQLERAFGKPESVDSAGWSWTVKDGAMKIGVESEETRDGKRMLTVNGIIEYSGPGGAMAVVEEEAPNFDPTLSVEWPGKPEESRTRSGTGTPAETTTYSAKYTLFEPITMFTATVQEFTEQYLQGTDAKEMLKSHALQRSQRPDDAVTEIARQGHPGVDVTGRDEAAHFRCVVVLVGRRLYQLKVLSFQPERLKADDVTNFFDSFQITDQSRL